MFDDLIVLAVAGGGLENVIDELIAQAVAEREDWKM